MTLETVIDVTAWMDILEVIVNMTSTNVILLRVKTVLLVKTWLALTPASVRKVSKAIIVS